MKSNNSIYTEINIKNLSKKEIADKNIIIRTSSRKNCIQVENTSNKILQVRFSTETKATSYFVKIGEARDLPKTKDSKNNKLYVRVLNK